MEDVAHDNKVDDFFFHGRFHANLDLMQAEELDNQCVPIILEMVVIIAQDILKMMELRAANRLQCELSICRVIEERSALARARELGETVETSLDDTE